MNQNIWGPHLWFSLHTISFNYPLNPTQEERNNFKNFFLNLQEVIPCSICKKNYIRHLKEHPIDNFLNNKKSLVYWVIDMHNMVNGEIGKKILPYDLVIKKYEEVYKKKIELNNNDNYDKKYNNKVNYKKLIYGLFILLLILLIINLINLFLKKKNI